MPWTDGSGWLGNVEAVRGRCLVSVVFDDKRFVQEPSENQGSKGRPGNVNHVGFSDEPPQFRQTWLADHAEWLDTVCKLPRGSLRDQRDFKLWRAVRIMKSR